MTPQVAEDLILGYTQGTLTVHELCSKFCVDRPELYKLLREREIPFRVPGLSMPRKKTVLPLEERLSAAKREVFELEAELAAKQISFQWVDDTSIVVRGVTEKFRKAEGLQKFLAFINKTYPQE